MRIDNVWMENILFNHTVIVFSLVISRKIYLLNYVKVTQLKHYSANAITGLLIGSMMVTKIKEIHKNQKILHNHSTTLQLNGFMLNIDKRLADKKVRI